jgi:hypothetical protein
VGRRLASFSQVGKPVVNRPVHYGCVIIQNIGGIFAEQMLPHYLLTTYVIEIITSS